MQRNSSLLVREGNYPRLKWVVVLKDLRGRDSDDGVEGSTGTTSSSRFYLR